MGKYAATRVGMVGVMSTDYAFDTVIWQRLAKLLAAYRAFRREVTIDCGLTRVVAERYGLGVRNGDQSPRKCWP